MPRSSQLAANDPQSRSPAASKTACISGARTKAKPSPPIASAIASRKSVILTSPIQTRVMWSFHEQFHPREQLATQSHECEAGHISRLQFLINATQIGGFTSTFSLHNS